MRFLSLIRVDESNGQAPSEQLMSDMGRLMEELTRDGKLVSTAGLRPTREGARVRLRKGGAVSVTDGPFTETKEVIGGFAILHFDSHEEAIAGARRVMQIHADCGVTDLDIEIRPMWDAPPCQA
jgi:hypothetical protein